jgi:hypothetical protein
MQEEFGGVEADEGEVLDLLRGEEGREEQVVRLLRTHLLDLHHDYKSQTRPSISIYANNIQHLPSISHSTHQLLIIII